MLLASLLVSVPLGLAYQYGVLPQISGAGYSATVMTAILVVAFFLAALLSCVALGLLGSSSESAPRAAQGKKRTPGRSSGKGRRHGEVKWFDVSKGFGFITQDDGSDVFVHVREVQGPRRRLRDGERVSFVVTQGKRGPQAQDVQGEG
jgi:CspA family cold shock protein